MPPDLANQFKPLACKADYTYSMTPATVKIQDTGKGKKSVAECFIGGLAVNVYVESVFTVDAAGAPVRAAESCRA